MSLRFHQRAVLLTLIQFVSNPLFYQNASDYFYYQFRYTLMETGVD